MDLFSSVEKQTINLLPGDGVVNYFGIVLTRLEADYFFIRLLESIAWKNDEAVIFGKRIITNRKVAWYGDKGYSYTYSNITKQALPWTNELLLLKTIVERKLNEQFNSCLLNLYHNGKEGMAWHSDGEKELKKNGAIASLSLGAERKFSFKHKQSKETVSINLEHGSLLVMKEDTQANWLHRLPPSKQVTRPRVNLTFRTIIS
ncbi:alpha-ketoglutarate-dependent dioxygenase AlkB family protein [Flavihumibacter profundi]|jgi:alkylated DNA repair dioxygenase AlkB|uniref:alpha-ketoglutarate-dependent dioxygenase AlkB family protein n=1 Tax=Flavihumibacter profundi TaxID=2716883 RepID=UPI001CC5580E|nr:alpha-ketoglutarate-dependent dioxygenase AlkB [Flavihumibacter profundi]MBZ5856150.1 alpha-ketoglutarate-dependent dioxygenase AlkB [Flavihumibacter profundi]